MKLKKYIKKFKPKCVTNEKGFYWSIKPLISISAERESSING